MELKEWGGGRLCNSVVEHLPAMHKVLDKDKRKKIYWSFYGDMAWFPLVQKLLCLPIAPPPPPQFNKAKERRVLALCTLFLSFPHLS